MLGVEFTDYLLWKLGGLCALAFVYRFWLAFTGRSKGERSDTPPE
jgi:hypothetical protein